jgi:hypothetical protein
VAGSWDALARVISKNARLVPKEPKSYFSPTSFWSATMGGKVWPAFGAVMGAVGGAISAAT